MDKEKQKSPTSDEASGSEKRYMKSKSFRKQQKQKRNQKIALISILSAVVIIAGSIAFYNVYKVLYGSIVTFDGRKISTEDLKLMNVVMTDSTKLEALDALVEYLVVAKAADERGLSLTDEEIATLKEDIPGFMEYVATLTSETPNVTDERLIELLGVETLYYKLQDWIVGNYEVDEEDFKLMLENYIENGKQYYIDTTLKYVLTEDEEKANAAYEALQGGMEVDEAIEQYTDGFEEYGIETIKLNTLELDPEVIEQIMALDVLEFSEVINLDSVYVIFIPTEINVPTEEEVEASYRDQYIYGKSTEVFDTLIAELTDASAVEINQRAFNSVK